MRLMVEKATEGMVRRIADNLRKVDQDELRAAAGKNPFLTTMESFRAMPETTWCVLVRKTREPIAVFGYSPVIEKWSAIVWMVGTDRIVDYKWDFLQGCRHWINWINRKFPVIFNYVDARNKVSIAWLKGMGFEFANEPDPYGVNGEPFYFFVRKDLCVNQQL